MRLKRLNFKKVTSTKYFCNPYGLIVTYIVKIIDKRKYLLTFCDRWGYKRSIITSTPKKIAQEHYHGVLNQHNKGIRYSRKPNCELLQRYEEK